MAQHDLTWSRWLSRSLLRLINVHQECVQVKTVRQDVISDVIPPDTESIHGDRVPALGDQLHGFQVRIHGDIDAYKMIRENAFQIMTHAAFLSPDPRTCDRPLDHAPIL